MSEEFVTKIGETGTCFRISFSEEKPEAKVSKLTLSSDFTHSYEESYEGEDDVLVVDIDYGDGNANEEANGNEDKDQDDIGSPESISRSSSLSNSYKREKPKFGLRRFKSVEEVIDVSPVKQKKKLQKTVSDYETRYKGSEKKEARLTLSADFTHSYEENFEEDGEMLIVDIDYSKGGEEGSTENFEDSVFSASDNFGLVGSGNESKLRKYHSHEDVRSLSYKHRELERSSSGYEITFINENKPEEMKKLSLSADLLTTGEEVVHPTTELGTQQPVTNIENVTEDELSNAYEHYLTSTPHKNAKSVNLEADIGDGGTTEGLENKKASLFVEEPEAALVIVSGSMPLCTVEPLESYNLASSNGNEARFREDNHDCYRGKEGARERKEDETWKMNNEKYSVSELDSTSQRHDFEAPGSVGPETSLEKQSVDKDRIISEYGLRELSERKRVIDDEDEIVPYQMRNLMYDGNTDYEDELSEIDEEASLERSAEVINDGMKIDLDDILIIDIDSNDRESANVIEDESSQFGRSTRRNNSIEFEEGTTSNRAELYTYSFNKITEDENATVNDDNKDFQRFDIDISQGEKLVSLKGTDDPNIPEKNDSVNNENTDSVGENDVVLGIRRSVDEEPNVPLYQADPRFGAKMRLLELAENGRNEMNESLGDDIHIEDNDYLKSKEDVDIDEDHARREHILIKNWKDNENMMGISDVERDNRDDSLEKNIQVDEVSDCPEAESDNKNLEYGVETGNTRDVDESFKGPTEDIKETLNQYQGDEDDEVNKHSDDGGGDYVDEHLVQEYEENANNLENIQKNKFFKMIITPEVENDHFIADSDEEGKGNTRRGSRQSEKSYECAKKCEYVFPMPYEMESVNKSDDSEKDEEWTGNEMGQASFEENETQREASSANERKIWRRLWPNFWWFRKISAEPSKSSKKGSQIELARAPIPNGSCKVEHDYDDDVALGKGETPKFITKVYRLKDIHHGRRLLTETIRVFFQEEDILSYFLEPRQ